MQAHSMGQNKFTNAAWSAGSILILSNFRVCQYGNATFPLVSPHKFYPGTIKGTRFLGKGADFIKARHNITSFPLNFTIWRKKKQFVGHQRGKAVIRQKKKATCGSFTDDSLLNLFTQDCIAGFVGEKKLVSNFSH